MLNEQYFVYIADHESHYSPARVLFHNLGNASCDLVEVHVVVLRSL